MRIPTVGEAIVAVAAGIMTAKGLHTAITEAEEPMIIEDEYSDLPTSKLRAHAIRTRFERELAGIKGVDPSHTKVTVNRSMIPFRHKYDITLDAKDSEDNPLYDPDSLLSPFALSISGKNNATGKINAVAVNPGMANQGIGRSVVESSSRAFKNLGLKRIALNPAFDGPLVWSKPYFGFNISPARKKDFLSAYKGYCRETGVEFKDLGDKPGNYPVEFLKDFDRFSRGDWHLMEYEKSAAHYKDQIEKTAGLGSLVNHHYYKAGVAYEALSHHIDVLAKNKLIDPVARVLFGKAKKALVQNKFSKSNKLYAAASKVAGFGEEGDSINKVNDAYNLIASPLQMAKAALLQGMFGGGV